ncbi:hypothetical protein COLO4_06675 [Corchorus olitorius]|uniref:Uncharacterized protein n=1 Tax=Corchorus olitorius TaxID=93759 RepID=A0A1R3KM94_9ROSI|nr:hypothetical protein COLO4_06675 [Corchorus olitorius]
MGSSLFIMTCPFIRFPKHPQKVSSFLSPRKPKTLLETSQPVTLTSSIQRYSPVEQPKTPSSPSPTSLLSLYPVEFNKAIRF